MELALQREHGIIINVLSHGQRGEPRTRPGPLHVFPKFSAILFVNFEATLKKLFHILQGAWSHSRQEANVLLGAVLSGTNAYEVGESGTWFLHWWMGRLVATSLDCGTSLSDHHEGTESPGSLCVGRGALPGAPFECHCLVSLLTKSACLSVTPRSDCYPHIYIVSFSFNCTSYSYTSHSPLVYKGEFWFIKIHLYCSIWNTNVINGVISVCERKGGVLYIL